MKYTEQRKIIQNIISKYDFKDFKYPLLDEKKLRYDSSKRTTEDYSEIGNTRIGGNPDLPKHMDYPSNEAGYYNLLIQLNFNELDEIIEPLPSSGILYLFIGEYDPDEYFIYYYDGDQKELELKHPPKGKENLHEYLDEPFKGVKVQYHLSYFYDYFFLEELKKFNPKAYEEFQQVVGFESEQILGYSPNGCLSAYRVLNGFPKLEHTVLSDSLGFGEKYNKQFEILISRAEKRFQNGDEEIAEYIRQLKSYDENKESHFESVRNGNTLLLLSIPTIEKCGMIWGDYHTLYLHMRREDIKNRNFSKFHVSIE